MRLDFLSAGAITAPELSQVATAMRDAIRFVGTRFGLLAFASVRSQVPSRIAEARSGWRVHVGEQPPGFVQLPAQDALCRLEILVLSDRQALKHKDKGKYQLTN